MHFEPKLKSRSSRGVCIKRTIFILQYQIASINTITSCNSIQKGVSLSCINVTKLLVQQAKPDREFKTGSRQTDRHSFDKDSVQQESAEACRIISP